MVYNGIIWGRVLLISIKFLRIIFTGAEGKLLLNPDNKRNTIELDYLGQVINGRESIMYDLVALGELLIDFTPAGNTKEGNALFERNPGGAPGNVLAMAAKLGKKTALISKVGSDQFGRFLTDVLKSINVETNSLIVTEEANTTLAFVHLDENGDRSFSFYRKPGADMLLEKSEVDVSVLKNCRIFHFGTVSMTHQPSRDATLFAVRTARERGAVISFDPNLRPPLWENLNDARLMTEEGLRYTHILKVSGEELEFITGTRNIEEGSKLIRDKYKIPVILVTLGPAGCFYRTGSCCGHLPAYKVNAIDTTGAGDAFAGAFLSRFIDSGSDIETIKKDQIEDMIYFANAAGSLTTTKKGAIPALPGLEEILKCQRGNNKNY